MYTATDTDMYGTLFASITVLLLLLLAILGFKLVVVVTSNRGRRCCCCCCTAVASIFPRGLCDRMWSGTGEKVFQGGGMVGGLRLWACVLSIPSDARARVCSLHCASPTSGQGRHRRWP